MTKLMQQKFFLRNEIEKPQQKRACRVTSQHAQEMQCTQRLTRVRKQRIGTQKLIIVLPVFRVLTWKNRTMHMYAYSKVFGWVWFGNIAGENPKGDASYVEKGSTSDITKGVGPQPHSHDPVVVYAEVNKSKEQRKGKTDVGPRATATLGVQPEEPHYEFSRGTGRNLAGIKPERH